MPPLLFTFRPGAVDHIKKTRNFGSDEQLAAALMVGLDELDSLRRGETPVTAEYALHIAGMQGDHHYLSGLFDPYTPSAHAA